ncbi:hypothetical protein N9N03_00505 [Chlamydiia bacterium]|nr:hypothetical protein [Chlamydiia bacterium]
MTGCTKVTKKQLVDVPRLFNFSEHMPKEPEEYVVSHVDIDFPEDSLAYINDIDSLPGVMEGLVEAGYAPNQAFDELEQEEIDFIRSYRYNQSDVYDVLIALSQKANINIVIDDETWNGGVYSGKFENVPFQVVFETLLACGNYDYKLINPGQSHQYILVGRADDEEDIWDRLSYNYHYECKHIAAGELREKLPTGVMRRSASVDHSTNSINVRAPRRILKDVVYMLEDMDAPQSQVLLEVKIGRISTNGKLAVGRALKSFESGNATITAAEAFGPKETRLLKDQPLEDVIDLLNILQTKGHASLVADPILYVLEGSDVEFTSDLTEYNFYQTRIDSGGGSEHYQRDSVNTGIKIKIKPTVMESGSVVLDISDLSIGSFDRDNINEENAQVSKYNIRTKVRVPNGETLYIAGIQQNQKEHSQEGLPGISDIPVLGWGVSQQESNNDHDEVFFLMKARVIG